MRYFLCQEGSLWRDNGIVVLEERYCIIVGVVNDHNNNNTPIKMIEDECNESDICSFERELKVLPL